MGPSKKDRMGGGSIHDLFGKSAFDIGLEAARLQSIGMSGLVSQSLVDTVLGIGSKLDAIGISGLMGKSAFDIGLEASRLQSGGITGLLGKSLIETALGAVSKLDSIGISGLMGRSVLDAGLAASRIEPAGISRLLAGSLLETISGSGKLGLIGVLDQHKSLSEAALGRSKVHPFGISDILGRRRLLESIVGAGALHAWDALGAPHGDDDPPTQGSLDTVVGTLDKDDPIDRLTGLVQATLEQVRRLSAQSRSVKAKALEAMAVLSFVWTLVTIFASASEPEWSERLRKGLQEAKDQDAANHKLLKERLDRLEELQQLDRAQTAAAEEEVARRLLEIQKKLSGDIQSQVVLVTTRTPLRWSPRSNGRVLERVAPGTIALVLNKQRQWVYVLLLDDAANVTRGGWITSGALSAAQWRSVPSP